MSEFGKEVINFHHSVVVDTARKVDSLINDELLIMSEHNRHLLKLRIVNVLTEKVVHKSFAKINKAIARELDNLE